MNATAYAAHRGSNWRIAIINKDLERDLSVDIAAHGMKTTTTWRLVGPTIDATENIRLAGAEIAGPAAQWNPQSVETIEMKGGFASVHVPKASAMVMFLA